MPSDDDLRPIVIQHIYRTPHCWILVIYGDDQAVQAFVVTITDKKFRLPLETLTQYQISATLPCLMAEIGTHSMQGRRLVLAARRFGYIEQHYFGNPGSYQNYFVGFNDAGIGGPPTVELLHRLRLFDYTEGIFKASPLVQQTALDSEGEKLLAGWREQVIANTIGIAGHDSDMTVVVYPSFVGVDQDHVRVLPMPAGPTRWTSWIARRVHVLHALGRRPARMDGEAGD
jgi:hypothetical protein